MSVDEVATERRATEMRDWYGSHQYKCRELKKLLEGRVERALRYADVRDPQVEARTKSVESFVAKASKVEGDSFKYESPQTGITDMIGVRVIVPLSTDQEPVLAVLRTEFDVTDEVERGDESGIDVPGYRSIHLTLRVSDEAADPEMREYGGMVAEIQVRTILQHAWASLQHDLGYKGERAPTPVIRRRLVALAGLIELADREFVDVRIAHLKPLQPSADRSNTDDLDGPVTATSVRLLTERLLGEDSVGQDWFKRLSIVLGELGVSSIEEIVVVLGPWVGRAREVHQVLQQDDRPSVNTAYTLDMLLRLALRDRYFEARGNEPIPGLEVQPETLARSRKAFSDEISSIARTLEDG